MQLLSGHTSPDTAYLVDDYPYGFRLRCSIRYWIETTKHGQRVVSQTTNPKRPGVEWNKPKASTYSPIRVLFLDELGHVVNEELNIYAGTAKIAAFETVYGAALSPEQRVTLDFLRRVARAQDERTAARAAAAAGGAQ